MRNATHTSTTVRFAFRHIDPHDNLYPRAGTYAPDDPPGIIYTVGRLFTRTPSLSTPADAGVFLVRHALANVAANNVANYGIAGKLFQEKISQAYTLDSART